MAELELRLDDPHEARVLGRAERRSGVARPITSIRPRSSTAATRSAARVSSGSSSTRAANVRSMWAGIGTSPSMTLVSDAGSSSTASGLPSLASAIRSACSRDTGRREAASATASVSAQPSELEHGKPGGVETTLRPRPHDRSAPRCRRRRGAAAQTRATRRTRRRATARRRSRAAAACPARPPPSRLSVAAPIANGSPVRRRAHREAPSSARRWRSGSSSIDPRNGRHTSNRVPNGIAASDSTRQRATTRTPSAPAHRHRPAEPSCRPLAHPRRPVRRCVPPRASASNSANRARSASLPTSTHAVYDSAGAAPTAGQCGRGGTPVRKRQAGRGDAGVSPTRGAGNRRRR